MSVFGQWFEFKKKKFNVCLRKQIFKDHWKKISLINFLSLRLYTQHIVKRSTQIYQILSPWWLRNFFLYSTRKCILFLLTINLFVFIIFLLLLFSVLLKNVASQLFNLQPVFDPSFASSTSSMCKAQTKIFIKSLEKLDLWALQSKYFFIEYKK